MAEILPFSAGRAKPRSGERDTVGEVIIFPGIRIEYHEEQEPGLAKRGRRGGGGGAPKDALSA